MLYVLAINIFLYLQMLIKIYNFISKTKKKNKKNAES